MKLTFQHKNKAYSVFYNPINENEPLQANGIRMLFLGMVAKHEPNIKKILEEINKNNQNIHAYNIEVSG